MNRMTVGVALGVLASAGVAQGQIEYGPTFMGSGVDIQSIYGVQWDGNPFDLQFNFGTSSPIISSNLFLQPTRTVIQDSYNVDATNYSSIEQLNSSVEFAGETASERFELSWDTSIQYEFADTISPADTTLGLFTTHMGSPSGLTLDITEDTRLRITFDADLSGMLGAELGGSGAVSNLAFFGFGGSAVPNAFTAGDGIATDVGSSFMVEFDVSAGTDLDIDFWLDNSVSSADAVLVDGFTQLNQINRGSLVIEVVPAPASAGVLAMGGLVAVRRRR